MAKSKTKPQNLATEPSGAAAPAFGDSGCGRLARIECLLDVALDLLDLEELELAAAHLDRCRAEVRRRREVLEQTTR